MQASYLSGMLVALTPYCSFPYYIDWMQSMSKINRSERSFTFGGLPENVITACLQCNVMKGNRTPEEAKMPLRIKPYKPLNLSLIHI